MPHDHQKSGFSKVYKIQKMIFPKIRRFLLGHFWIHFLTFAPTGQDRSKVGHNLVPFNTFFLVRFLTVHLLRKTQLRWEKSYKALPYSLFDGFSKNLALHTQNIMGKWTRAFLCEIYKEKLNKSLGRCRR